MIESLEARQLLSATPPTITLSPGRRYFSAVHGTRAPSRAIKIANTGTQPMVIPAGGITISGGAVNEFKIAYMPALPLTIQPGKSANISIIFKPPAAASGIKTTTLHIVSNDPNTPVRNVKIRGLITNGSGGTLEPSLQRILDLYQIDDNVGETNPDQTLMTLPPATPNDEVEMQLMTEADTSLPVTVSLLGVFDNMKTPATAFGFYSEGDSADASQLFTVPLSTDSQTVNPGISGPTSFNPSGTFGIYTLFPAFSNRKSFSEDSLNTWESITANQKKIRFYPYKNPDGTVVPNSYVFATEDWNVTYDYNDVVGVISNVKAVAVSSTPPGTGAGNTGSNDGDITQIADLTVRNNASLPSNDRAVFNRITHPDTVRANVTDDEDSFKLTNNGDTSMTIDSISLLDSVNFSIVSGGGTDITLAPGASRTIEIHFNGTDAGNSILKTFQTNMLIKANGNTDTVVLSGLWQSYSEQTPANPHHVYDEPSLSTIVNTVFGYTTDIADGGQTRTDGFLVKLGTHGDRTAVGSEVLSDYWQASGSSAVSVRLLAAFHRQNNFDPVTDAAETAASTLSYYYQGSSDDKHKLFQHNINEGQSLLPHNSGSTTAYAQGSFTPSSGKAFGFKVDSQFSDDSLNSPDFDPDTMVDYPEPTGHAFRFYPLKDENGNTVPNTYIMAMDYTGLSYSNYDYQDNIYIVSGIKPAEMTSAMSVTSSQESAKSASTAPTSSLASQMDLTDSSNDSVLD